MEAEYLTEKETAQYTGTKLTTLRSWRRNKTGLPYTKINGSVRYSKTEIDKYMESQRVKTNNAEG